MARCKWQIVKKADVGPNTVLGCSKRPYFVGKKLCSKSNGCYEQKEE